MITEIMEYLGNQIDEVNYSSDSINSNIFDNTLPSSPDLAIMVENTGGFPRDMKHIKYFRPTIRVLVRGSKDPRQARNLSEKIIDSIGTLGNIQFGKWRIVKSQAVQSHPINIGRDDNDRHRFSCNFELEIQEV